MSPGKWAARSREYLGEVQSEFRKVTWPTEKETVAGTVSVIAVLAIIAVVLAVVDYSLSVVMSWVLP